MLFRYGESSLSPVISTWLPKELELEKRLIAPSEDRNVQFLSEHVFGEPLLLVSNQVRTRHDKRADLLALDRSGNGVIVELKRGSGRLGVETQALQYLADFSLAKGEGFIRRFAENPEEFTPVVRSFLGGNADLRDLNRNLRIILIARDFDETIFSLGEWLSGKGVSFRCIAYTPIELDGQHYVSFSVRFDRSSSSLYGLGFSAPGAPRAPGIFWHNIARSDQAWWQFLVTHGQIPACFDDSPGDRGEQILTSYLPGDRVVAYARGHGAVGWAEVTSGNKYRLIAPGSEGDVLNGGCRHRLAVTWKACAPTLKDGLPADVIRTELGIYHPISTSVSIGPEPGERLLKRLTDRFGQFRGR